MVTDGLVATVPLGGTRPAASRGAAPGAARTARRDGPAPADHPRRRVWAWVRLLVGLAILAVLLARLGIGGFVDGLRMVDAGTLLAACGIGLLTTVLSAWRWRLVARGLGITLPLRAATADYYRALFLNAALPGGILGDAHRAVRHGRDVGDLGLGVRAVVLERTSGQVVVVAVAVALLLAFPGPRPPLPELVTVSPVVAAMVLVGGLAAAVLAVVWLRRAAPRLRRALHTGGSAVRRGLLARRVWPGIVLSSTMVLAGYLAMFLVAARAAGTTASTVALLPLLVLALLAMALPINVGGWGPREGACAWAFGAAGLGATQGLTVAVVYGLSALVASLPGAAVLLAGWFSRRPGWWGRVPSGIPECRKSQAPSGDPGQPWPGVTAAHPVPNRSESA